MAALPSMDEILREITKIEKTKIDGFTTADLAKATGRCRNWCQSKVRYLIDIGKVEYAGTVNSTTIDNRMCKISIYRVIK